MSRLPSEALRDRLLEYLRLACRPGAVEFFGRKRTTRSDLATCNHMVGSPLPR
jgi:hypothetical protein